MALRSQLTRSSLRRSGSGGGSGGGGLTSINGDTTPAQLIISADGSVTITQPVAGTTDLAVPPSVATWTIGVTRIYAVDGVNGNDANKGYADPASSSTADYAISCAAAGAVAKKTFAGLAAIFPRSGAGRKVEIVILGGGTVYAGTIGDALNGVAGYANACPFVRGTFTNATASSVAFAGSTADVAYAGAQTATGMNAAGYNPTGTPTSSQIQCLKVGGAAPAFGAEPAVPLGWRIRFNSTTATAALRNVCRQVSQVSGTDTLSLQTVLPAVPAAGDVFYLEMGGWVQGALSLQGVTQVGTASQGLTLVSMLLTGTLTTGANCVIQMSLCGANAHSHSGIGQIVVQQGETHPALGGFTFGGGFRSETTSTMAANRGSLFGYVTATDWAINTPNAAFALGAGCAARSITIRGMQSEQNDDTANLAVNIGTGATVGIPHTFGAAGGGGLTIDGCTLSLGAFNFIGAGGSPAILVKGKNNLVFVGVLGGSTGNTDVGMDLQNATGSYVELRSGLLPTVTGTAGDVRMANGALLPWTNLNFEEVYDQAGNHIFEGNTNGAAYGYTISPSVMNCVVNNGGAMAYATAALNTGTNLQVKSAQANTLANATGFAGVMIAGANNGAACLVGGSSGYKVCQFDAAPVVGAVVYLSKTAGQFTTTVPPLSLTAAKLRIGICVGNAFAGNLGVVRMTPEIQPVLADGLP